MYKPFLARGSSKNRWWARSGQDLSLPVPILMDGSFWESDVDEGEIAEL